MFRYFGKSRGVFAAGLVLTAALAVTMGVRRAQGPVWIAVITVLLALALGTALSVLVANLIATGCEQSIQEKLHMDLDPEGFIQAYAPAAARMKPGSAARCAAAANLAEAHCAAGRWQQALSTLEEPGPGLPPARTAALRALVLRCRCRYLLWGQQPTDARRVLDELKALLQEQTAENPGLAVNLRPQVRLYGVWAAILEGHPADAAGLEEQMRRLPTKLDKLDTCWMLRLNSRLTGDTEAEQRFTALLASEGGQLACAREARGETA